VQKFALRTFTKHWETSLDDLLQLFAPPSLQQCRLHMSLWTTHVLMNHTCWVEQLYLPQHVHLINQWNHMGRSSLEIFNSWWSLANPVHHQGRGSLS